VAFQSVLGVAGASAEHLARLASQSLGAGVLSYSRRQDLLRAARRLGVGRFQANLIIAAVQHRHRSTPVAPGAVPSAASRGWVGMAALILAVEAVLVLGAAVIMRHH
jgi:hypothetical protein